MFLNNAKKRKIQASVYNISFTRCSLIIILIIMMMIKNLIKVGCETV